MDESTPRKILFLCTGNSARSILGEYPMTEGVDEDEWLRAAALNPAFHDLAAPEEDLYSLEDGDPVLGQASKVSNGLRSLFALA